MKGGSAVGQRWGWERDEPVSEIGTQKARWGQLPSPVQGWTVAPVTQATALSPRGSQALLRCSPKHSHLGVHPGEVCGRRGRTSSRARRCWTGAAG